MNTSTQCKICSGNNSKVIQPTYVTFNSKKINFVKCQDCGLIYLHPQLTAEEIKQLYSDDYFIKWYNSEEKRAFSKNYFNQLLTRKNIQIPKGSQLLDIGCGMGFFLEVAQQRNCIAKGVEISQYASAHCKEKLHFDVHHGTLETADFDNEIFDTITAFDVLEHLLEPSNLLDRVNKICKKNGTLMVIVPNYDSLIYQFEIAICKLKKEALPNIPEHLTYFTRDTLKKLLEKHGFKIQKLVSVDANDEGERFRLHGNMMALFRGKLTKVCFYLGKMTNRRDAILAVAKKV